MGGADANFSVFVSTSLYYSFVFCLPATPCTSSRQIHSPKYSVPLPLQNPQSDAQASRHSDVRGTTYALASGITRSPAAPIHTYTKHGGSAFFQMPALRAQFISAVFGNTFPIHSHNTVVLSKWPSNLSSMLGLFQRD